MNQDNLLKWCMRWVGGWMDGELGTLTLSSVPTDHTAHICDSIRSTFPRWFNLLCLLFPTLHAVFLLSLQSMPSFSISRGVYGVFPLPSSTPPGTSCQCDNATISASYKPQPVGSSLPQGSFSRSSGLARSSPRLRVLLALTIGERIVSSRGASAPAQANERAKTPLQARSGAYAAGAVAAVQTAAATARGAAAPPPTARKTTTTTGGSRHRPPPDCA